MKKFFILLFSVLIASSSVFIVGCGGKAFTVSFSANGGTLIEGTEIQTVKSAGEIVAPKYEKEGYTFDGWDKVIKEISSDTVVTAQWKANRYTITLDSNGGECSVSSVGVIYGESLGELPFPTLEEHAFAGWRLNDVDGKQIATGEKWTFSKDVKLVATWVKNAYSIVYDLEGGSFEGGYKTTYSANDETFVLPKPVKDNAEFLGWIENGSSEYVIEITKGSIGNRYFKAVWESNEYTVNFVLNVPVTFGSKDKKYTQTCYATVNGQREIPSVKVGIGETLGDKLPIPVPEDAEEVKFSGWTYKVGDKVYSIDKDTVFSKETLNGLEGFNITLQIKLMKLWYGPY